MSLIHPQGVLLKNMHERIAIARILVGLLCLSCLLSPPNLYAQSSSSDLCKQAEILVKTVKDFHYAPKAINDAFGVLVYTNFLKQLEEEGFGFTQSQINQLQEASSQIDEDLNNGHCTFLETAQSVYRNQLEIKDSLIQVFKEQAWKVNRPDFYTYAKSSSYPDIQSLSQTWQKWLHLQLMIGWINQSDSLSASSVPESAVFSEKKQRLLDQKACEIFRQLSDPTELQEYIGNVYLQSIATAFDPHTYYFSLSQKERFDGMLSEESMSYGFRLFENEQGEVEIAEIVPGSPAWKSNSLHEGDVLISVQVSSSDEIKFDCEGQAEALRMLRSPDVSEASFEVRKQSGKVLNVNLFKGKTQVEENIIQSFILQGDRKIGYLYLPSFYTDMESAGFPRKGCSNEVAKELIRLKREGIEALIFDLRGNGGGSMYEAMRIAGMFINFGAVAMIDTRDEAPEILKDDSRGLLFNAPLLVLQNRMSASASELFAATIQDYHRGVILGSDSYGKATMQQIMPVDAYKYRNPYEHMDEATGFVKLTMGSFFRVTGESHQRMGVKADIVLPQADSNPDRSENASPTALPNKPLDKDSYYRPLKQLPLEELQTASKKRLDEDAEFMRIAKVQAFIEAEALKKEPIPLSFDLLRAYITERPTRKTQAVDMASFVYKVDNPDYLKGISSLDPTEKKFNEKLIRDVQTDKYIQEAFFVAEDLLTLLKK